MLNTLFLLAELGVLVAFLALRRVPRRVAFETVFISIWIFYLGYSITEEAIAKFAPNLLESVVPYLPPVIPVVIFVIWFLPRAEKLMG